MPYLNLTTNVKLDDAKAFALDFSKFSAKVLKKPESYIAVSYTYNDTLTFGGSFEPSFQLSVISLGNINPEVNVTYSKAISDYLGEKLGTSNSRGYITFVDPGYENLGYSGKTFAAP
ncbi:Tautomerase MIF [Pyrrhoderma noxium]|uniref:L-dopachrome isomerase n=1 Tax=Pyrrhoderma noxium TaxID=2282107 RepID=A0A286UJ83_9AGAM|nr:Tautomerase MIF [Pyrrhoderma noxium]